MIQTSIDSTQTYFVTAQTGAAAACLEDQMTWLAAACSAATGDAAPRIVALASLPGSLVAVLQTPHWDGARPFRRARLWQRRAPSQLRAYRLTTDAQIQERIDYCHFAPVLHGLVRHPAHWCTSTVHHSAASDMLLA